MRPKFYHRLAAAALGTTLAILVGCYAPTKQSARGPAPRDPEQDLFDAMADADKAFENLALAATPAVRELYTAAFNATAGPKSLAAAVRMFKDLPAGERTKADPRLMSRIEELLAAAAYEQVRDAQEKGQSGATAGAALKQVAESTKDPGVKQVAEAGAKASGDPNNPEVVKSAKEAVKTSGQVLKEKATPPDTEEAPEEIKQYETKAKRLVTQIQGAVGDAEKMNNLLKEFAENEKLAATAMGKALKDGTAKASQVLGVAAGIAGAAGQVVDFIDGFKDRDTLGNLAAGAGALGGVLQSIQPFITGAAAQYKAAAVVACMILQQILPIFGNIADLKFPGPKLGGGQSDKPSDDGGEDKDNKGGKGGKGGGGKGDKSDKADKGKGAPPAKPKTFKPTAAQKADISAKAEKAENAVRDAQKLPKDASIDPKKVNMDKARETIAEAVSGGDPKIKAAVEVALNKYPSNDLGALCERGASAAVAFGAGYGGDR